MKEIIKNFFAQNFTTLPKRLTVAVSGGVDSLALVFLLRDFCVQNDVKLFAVTVDHKMRKGSSLEALQLNKLLTKNKISHEILTISAKQIPQKNIEANLRDARYEMLYEFCLKNKTEHLFLGHHLGDVAENFLIRLFRGSQLDGLSVMQKVSQHKQIKLLRPLLNTPKEELQKYLQGKKISWFEDESNDDEKFLRNKIRKFLAQFEEGNLIQKRIKNAAEIIKESKDFIDDILLREAASCLAFNQDGSFIIDLKKYQKIPTNIALKILSLVLIETSGNQYKPRLDGLKNFEKNILNLEKGKKKNFYGCMAKLCNNQDVKLMRASQNMPHQQKSLAKNKTHIHKNQDLQPPQLSQEKYLLIYRDETAVRTPPQKFDEKTTLIDGRFLQKNNAKKPYKFYFRTILGSVFEKIVS